MKKLLLQALCVAALPIGFISCSNDGRIKERPDNIVPTGPRLEIFQRIMAQFPEHKSVMQSEPALFSDTVAKQIVLKNESEVYVTYISEGASYPNSFGWYSYSAGSKPSSSSQIEKHILFPHVSNLVLKQGDRLQLGDGKFPAGTVIGFFMVINGWQNGAVNYDQETFYTDSQLNPNGSQQHVLFKDSELGDLVLAFEDIQTANDSDQDFNDIIFTVTDNTSEQEAANFDLTNVEEL